MSAEWRVEPWIGGNGYKGGFYVARSACGKTEWMQNSKKRAARFRTADEAKAAIAKAKS